MSKCIANCENEALKTAAVCEFHLHNPSHLSAPLNSEEELNITLKKLVSGCDCGDICKYCSDWPVTYQKIKEAFKARDEAMLEDVIPRAYGLGVAHADERNTSKDTDERTLRQIHEYETLYTNPKQEGEESMKTFDEELDKILEAIVVATANQYGGYGGRDEETESDIKTAKQALKEAIDKQIKKAAKPKASNVSSKYSTSVVDRIAYDAAFDNGVMTYYWNINRALWGKEGEENGRP